MVNGDWKDKRVRKSGILGKIIQITFKPNNWQRLMNKMTFRASAMRVKNDFKGVVVIEKIKS